MKTIFSIAVCLAIAIGASAQQTGRNTNQAMGMGDKPVKGYSQTACNCVATQQDSKIIVFRNGREEKNGVTLSPGIKITGDGLLKKEGGAERMLVAGNCVSEKGTITMVVN